ncbi:MAG: prephenate dehydrogenase/arogenate dehydrogenase family protein [Ectothiorhodospiraceae bacterium]|jgi:prephenate dehydrogenase
MIRVERLAIIGVGLIGGSLALALRESGVVGEIVGCGRSEDSLRRAVELGVVDRYCTDAAEAVRDADVVVLGVPLGAVRGVLERIGGSLPERCVVTDVGSVKGTVVADARAVFGEVPANFVPGHPIAGTEKSGVEAAFPELFRGRRVILTPAEGGEPTALATVRGLWQAAGAEVICMSVAHHDRMLSATSHLPHLLAYGLVDTLARWDTTEEVFQYAAGGFRDFTRIASSDPVMWRDICLANRDALLDTLQRYRDDLSRLTALVREGDAAGLEAVFGNAKRTRDRYLDVFEK